MEFAEVCTVGAGEIYLYIFEEASDFDLKCVSVAACDFGKAFYHDPRDAVVGADDFVVDDDEPYVCEYDQHVLLTLVLFHHTLLVSRLSLLLIDGSELGAE